MGWFAAVAVMALAALHGELLLRRLADNSIAEPLVLLRWLGGLGLLIAARIWRRTTGRSVLTGRSALVFALLVALLHAGLPAAPQPANTSVALPGEILALGLVGVLLAAALLAGALGPPRGWHRVGSGPAGRCRAPRSLAFGFDFSPRPPPTR